MTRTRKLALVLATLCALLVGSGMPIQRLLAHADVDHADPAVEAVVAEVPTQVRIWFTQELFRRQGMNRVEVYNADGVRVDQDDAAIDDDDRTLVTVSLPPALPDGVYTVRWHSLSAEDGHEGQGEFTFTVAAAAAVEGDPEEGDAIQEEASPTVTPTPATTATPTLAATPETATATLSAVTPTSTASQPEQPATVPCLGGAAPLALAVSMVLTRRRRARYKG